MNYKMILAYDGTRYNGWQKQGNTDRTIQGKLEQILTRMAGRPIEVFGSGRTDRGVHAEGQTANFHLKQTEEYEDKSLQILEYINTYLPEDIAVLSCEAVPERFHSRLSAARKTYRISKRLLLWSWLQAGSEKNGRSGSVSYRNP